jgi:hypothetical protein
MVQTRVQFIHGLAGSPQGTSARVLSQHFETLTPAMDTSANREIEDERKPSIAAGLDRMTLIGRKNRARIPYPQLLRRIGFPEE